MRERTTKMVKLENSQNEELDRFSELSEHIIHHILSYVPMKDAGRTCILSNTWKSLCSSYNIVPSLHYDHNSFALKLLLEANESEPKIDEIRDKFMNYVDSEMSSVIQQQSPVLNLEVDIPVIDSEFGRVDQFMDLLRKAKVEELRIFVQTSDFRWHDDLSKGNIFYDFPYSLVLESKYLLSLTVQGCRFTYHDEFMINKKANMFSSLRQLYLSQVWLSSKEAVSNLAHCCPEIELIEFDRCSFSITTLRLSKFRKLKKAYVKGDRHYGLQWVDITKNKLETFHCTKLKCLLSLGTCSGIKELSLNRCTLNKSDVLKDFATYFPLIETANLSTVTSFEDSFDRITVTNPHIRTLKLALGIVIQMIKVDCPNLRNFVCTSGGFEEMHMKCPKLRTYYYSSNKVPESISLDLPTNMRYVHFYIRLGQVLDTSWFISLRKFLQQTQNCNNIVYVYLVITPNTMTPEFDLDRFKAFQTCKHHNVHLQLEMQFGVDRAQISSAPALVDCLFWSIQPAYLYIGGNSYDFVKHLCHKLAEKSGHKSCCDQHLCKNYWWHNISDFYVEHKDEDMKLNLGSLVKLCKQNDPSELSYKNNLFRRMPTRFEFEWRST